MLGRAVGTYLEGGGGATYQLGLTVNCLHANWSWLLLPRFFKIFILVKKRGGGAGPPVPTAMYDIEYTVRLV